MQTRLYLRRGTQNSGRGAFFPSRPRLSQAAFAILSGAPPLGLIPPGRATPAQGAEYAERCPARVVRQPEPRQARIKRAADDKQGQQQQGGADIPGHMQQPRADDIAQDTARAEAPVRQGGGRIKMQPGHARGADQAHDHARRARPERQRVERLPPAQKQAQTAGQDQKRDQIGGITQDKQQDIRDPRAPYAGAVVDGSGRDRMRPGRISRVIGDQRDQQIKREDT